MNKISKIDKVERYDWVKPGDNGRQCKVPVDELKVDHAYQRPEVSERNTLALARGFNWVAFNSIVVMERANGDKFVVDGQQRLLAARHRGDIPAVPCVLFKSDGRDHEARAFISLNVRRTNVPAVAKFNASVRAALNPEKQIADWLSTQGLEVTEDGKAMNGVDFPSTLIRSWNLNADACKKAIAIQRDVNGTDPLHSTCHKGIFWMLHNGINVEEHADKLKRLGGRSAILRSVKTLEIETGSKASERGCGIGVLRLVNYKRRSNKIAVPETV
jgi:hypothetical protein